MPKAAAPSPGNWATVYPNFTGFDIDDLNRVVLDYAPIELEAAARVARRPVWIRLVSKVMPWVAILGLGGPLIALVAGFAGTSARRSSGDYSPGFEIPYIYIGCVWGAVSVLYIFGRWVQSRYRQWDRSLFGFTMLMLVPTVLLLGLLHLSETAASPRALALIAPWVLLGLLVGVICAEFRLYSKEKPPAVDPDDLSAEELDVLLKMRRLALTTLRGRSVISYQECDEFDRSPLRAARSDAK